MKLRSKFVAAVAAVALAMGLCPAFALADDATLQAGSAALDGATSTQEKIADKVQRLEGETALGTMAQAVNEGWKSSETVVVATFGGYWDALAASALAGSEGAPVLLTFTDSLVPETEQLIKSLGAKKAYICGGPAAVSDGVEKAIKDLGVETERLYGATAFDTAEKVSAKAKANLGELSDTCVVATIDGFYDSLSMAPASYALGMPVYLTNGDKVLAASTIEAIKAAGYKNAVIVGGTAAVKADVEGQLASAGIAADSVTRLAGDNAWQTSQKIADWSLEKGMSPRTMGVADGNGFWDALTGAPLVGLKGGPLVLVPHDGPNWDNSATFAYNPHCIDTFITDNAGDIEKVYVFGGPGAVPEKTYDAVVEALSKAPATVELAITNNTGMFKAVTASALENSDGSATLTMALSGTGYHYLFKGTYEEAVANGSATDKWIAGAQNADGKWEFQIPVTKDELGTEVPVVAISQSYYEKSQAGENPVERAFFPRQFNLDLDKATLTTGDFVASKDIAITNNVKMFKPGTTATFTTVGGPNSNGYTKTLTLNMESTSYTKAFVGTPAEAAEAAAADVAELGEGNTFALKMLWMGKAGDLSTITSKWTDGEPFVISFWSAKNEQWYGRQATLDEKAATLVFDPWTDPAPASNLDELIQNKLQVQTFADTTYADCETAKKMWDEMSEDERALLEEYDYFGLDTGDASKDDPLNQDKIGENEILVVSFGTSFNDSRVATIGGVEKALAAAYPDWSVRRAFTAQIIINHIYARDGEKIDNVAQAMDRAVANGVKNLIVQPTHLMHGAEYDELKAEIDKYAGKMSITYAEPLLGEVGADGTAVNADKEAVAKAVVAEAAAPEDTALVLMGHGTAHVANVTYTQMQAQMDALGYKNVFVGTVEGEPEGTDAASIIAKVKDAGYKKVILRPLMVVAGDHANNDMADPEDEESWVSQFNASGAFDSVECQIAGLGQIPAIQQIYVAHTRAVMPLADGTYKLPGLATKTLSMYHFDADAARAVVKGDEAWLITSIDGKEEAKTLDRFDGMAYGPQSKILDAADATNHTLVAGTPVATVSETKDDSGTVIGRTFVLPIDKEVLASGGDIFYMIKYRDGFNDSHNGDWYKASGGDYSLTGYTLEYESADTSLSA